MNKLINSRNEDHTSGNIENKTLGCIKAEYIDDSYYEVKVEEHPIDKNEFYIKNKTGSCHGKDDDLLEDGLERDEEALCSSIPTKFERLWN